jgi:hypothetical protein
MIDTAALLQGIDLPSLIAKDTDGPAKNRMFCPMCQEGGAAHNNSPALSVRDGYYHCFGCGAEGDAISYVMTRDEVNFQEACKRLGWDGYEPDKAELARRNIERQIELDKQQVQRAAELNALLADYSAEEIWHAYNYRMTTDQRAWWIKRGIEPDWQDYLQLGFVPNKTYRGKDNILYHSPAYTIPYFHTGHKFQTMQYRLENPDNPKDRYRFEHGLKAAYYQVIDSEQIQECAIICEGAIKAMVTHIYGDTGNHVSLLAVPAKETYAGVVDAVKHCHHVWIILDPDCWDQPKNAPTGWEPSPLRLAKQIGKAAKIVRLPYKVDDLFIAGELLANEWKKLLRDAK